MATNMKGPTILPALAAGALVLSACVATKFEMTPKGAPPPVLLNLVATQPPVALGLRTTIIYDGPGSWKREALWDEYVVTLRNEGERVLAIGRAELVDPTGASVATGNDPWALEKESQTLEQRYQRAGVAFVRGSVPRLLMTGASAATATAGGAIAGGVATAAAVSVVALPVYYVVVWSVNHSNKAAVTAEFARRRLGLPLSLAPGETRTGSFFFPMVPNPQSLKLQWSSGSASAEVVLSLESLYGLHAGTVDVNH